MNRSKLHVCTEILCHLASKGPMNFYSLIARVNLKEVQLSQHLAILKDSGLIRIQNFDNFKTFFELTESGLTVLKMYSSLLSEAQDNQSKQLKTNEIPL